MKVLHILRSLDDGRALATARSHSLAYLTSLLLLQDAVLARIVDFPGPVYACAEDVAARSRRGDYREIGYEEMVGLLLEHEKIICW